MPASPDTIRDTGPSKDGEGALPGVIAVHCGGEPMRRVIPVGSEPVILGRESRLVSIADERMSREHGSIRFDGGAWTVRDFQSRNGTFIDGEPVHGEVSRTSLRTIRMGHTILVPCLDVRPFVNVGITIDDEKVAGPAMTSALAEIADSARAFGTLLVTGETGSGKELASRAYHQSGPNAGGPMIAVNCATIAEGVAERLLFGAKRGSFSGASADVGGYAQAADGGVLFLDEVAELDLEVQAKLLRFVETREVVPVGATTGTRVDVRLCFATHRDLRDAARDGKFRTDLFYRIGNPEVRLPPLRDRLEEIPWLIAHTIRQATGAASRLTAHAKVVEACMLRRWPGNVRELVAEIRRAMHRAVAANAKVVRLEHLRAGAGESIVLAPSSPSPVGEPRDASDARARSEAPRDGVGGRDGRISETPSGTPGPGPRSPSREALQAALAAHRGSVARAATQLGLHRSYVYRLMRRFGLDGTEP